MEKRYATGTEQMLIPVTDEIVDFGNPGLNRDERDRLGGVNEEARSMVAGSGHDVAQGGGCAVLRAREAEGNESRLRPNRVGQVAESHSSQLNVPGFLRYEKGIEYRGELIVRNDDLDAFRKRGGDETYSD
jgi:hypothetical protein